MARSGANLVRAGAVGATVLAAAGAEIAAHLIEINLLVEGDDERSLRALELSAAAASSRDLARALRR